MFARHSPRIVDVEEGLNLPIERLLVELIDVVVSGDTTRFNRVENL
jgi:hypothetical protein